MWYFSYDMSLINQKLTKLLRNKNAIVTLHKQNMLFGSAETRRKSREETAKRLSWLREQQVKIHLLLGREKKGESSLKKLLDMRHIIYREYFPAFLVRVIFII